MSADPRALVAGLRRVGIALAQHGGAAPFICASHPGGIAEVDRIALRVGKPELLGVLPACPLAHGPLVLIG